MTRSNNHSLRLDLRTSYNNALHPAIFNDKLRNTTLEMHLSACIADSIAHIGNDAGKSVRADVWVCLI